MDLSQGFCDGDAKGDAAVQDRNAHLNLSDLAVKVACHQLLVQQFHAMHLCLDVTTAVIATPVPLGPIDIQDSFLV
jgi:hypothetical protein